MDFLLSEILEQVVDLAVLRHKEGGTQQHPPLEGLHVEVGQEVLHIEDAAYLVEALLVDGNAGKTTLDDGVEHLAERHADFHGDDVDTGFHHVAHFLLGERGDAFQHVLLVQRGRRLGGDVNGGREVIHGDVGLLPF